MKNKPDHERRKFERKRVLDTFQIFLTIPKLGPHRYYLQDLSETGLAVRCEPRGQIKTGAVLPTEFHLNQGLHLPLNLRVIRVADGPDGEEVAGCEIAEPSTGHSAFRSFVRWLDELVKFLPES